jgi:hypothetical protein
MFGAGEKIPTATPIGHDAPLARITPRSRVESGRVRLALRGLLPSAKVNAVFICFVELKDLYHGFWSFSISLEKFLSLKVPGPLNRQEWKARRGHCVLWRQDRGLA